MALDLGRRHAGSMIQPLMRKLVADDVLGLIPGGAAAVTDDRHFWRFDPEAARCTQATVSILQWH
ncbi:hypothetical protein ACFWNE_34305 [Streptomyces goshikiensis]|uniref:hypothetical protein n=1 Tax=Streptomyces goshikiensis TaxID=1942 RepID=UPI0036490F0C